MDTNALWKAALDLHKEIWVKKNNKESDYQRIFEENPVIFKTLGFDTWASFEKSSSNKLPFCDHMNITPEPDFICAKSRSGETAIIDLKTPFVPSLVTSRSDGNRKKFRATVSSYISQVEEYIGCIKGSEGARGVVCSTLGIRRISKYYGAIIIGLEEEEFNEDIVELSDRSKNNISIINYDELQGSIISLYSVGRKDIYSANGFCIAFNLILFRRGFEKRGYIFDCGNTDKNRISCFLEGDKIVFEVIGDDLKLSRFEANYKINKPTPVIFQCSINQENNFTNIFLDGKEVMSQADHIPLNTKIEFRNVTVGADLNQQNNGEFGLDGPIIYSKTLSIQERLNVETHLYSKTVDDFIYAEYNGSSCMVLS